MFITYAKFYLIRWSHSAWPDLFSVHRPIAVCGKKSPLSSHLTDETWKMYYPLTICFGDFFSYLTAHHCIIKLKFGRLHTHTRIFILNLEIQSEVILAFANICYFLRFYNLFLAYFQLINVLTKCAFRCKKI